MFSLAAICALVRPWATRVTSSRSRALFLNSQAEAILACDFFSVDLFDGTQAYVLTAIEHATRRIRILGVTPHPTGQWTSQQALPEPVDLDQYRSESRLAPVP
jgi:putative transposase